MTSNEYNHNAMKGNPELMVSTIGGPKFSACQTGGFWNRTNASKFGHKVKHSGEATLH